MIRKLICRLSGRHDWREWFYIVYHRECRKCGEHQERITPSILMDLSDK